MADFTPNEAQARAIADIKDWFNNRTETQQVYRVFGYAGTGKSTLVAHVIKELKLDGVTEFGTPQTLYGTFTGKAAYVLRKKGTPCRTIHSLIYSVSEATEEQMGEVRQKIDALSARWLRESGQERFATEAQIKTLDLQLKDMKRPQFRLNTESPVRDCKLLVLDEVSMVGDDMASDLLSFGKPVLVLGDPGQLPPIRGSGSFTQHEPDVMLTEIHRQAAESAIIRLATLVREGGTIPYGMHDQFVCKMRRTEVTPQQMLQASQVICGKNATRLDLNNALRRAAGFEGRLPSGPGEKLICLKNQNDIGLINGMFVMVHKVSKETPVDFTAKIETEDERVLAKRRIYAGHFDDHHQFDPDRVDNDWKIRKPMTEMTFGWAITCHKAQGSQWENVIVYDDHLGRAAEDRTRWLYTAITRAVSGLVILD